MSMSNSDVTAYFLPILFQTMNLADLPFLFPLW
jgi:hypothetical protein